MATKTNTTSAPRKKSKREKRQKLIVYIMIFAMVLSTITMGLAYFISL
ncbi:stressosome-associated protein Prli42 [Oceanobacillus bengalensis]|nr:stressosome-associated protein Prli42 [Oceanobacillus bengalensis]